MHLTFFDLIALTVFFVSWFGYTKFAKKKAKTTDCIARSLHRHRIFWMEEVMSRELRMTDAALLANLERSIAFFASSSLLILAGLLTLFAQTNKIQQVVAALPYVSSPSETAIQIKLCLLTIIFVIAFFNFTWSMRQYGFVNVMLGAAPGREKNTDKMKEYAVQMAVVQDQAAHSYNYGLRAYYFSLAATSWFYHPLLLIVTSLIVVYTLYQREFRSKAVNAITSGKGVLEGKGKV